MPVVPLERHAYGVIFLEPCFCGVSVCEHLEMIGITDLLARVDVDVIVGPS
jgi:hypothetical protein